MSGAPLTAPLWIGDVQIGNRVLLAPLAGIGTWFVRLQARRHGAGLAVSEMISSHAIRHGNRRTLEQMLVVHPEEHPVSLQLFGQEPDAIGEAAAITARAGADLIDLNMGCPVRKVRRTGAGAELLADPGRAVEIAIAAREASGRPVTVKLRSGLHRGDSRGLELATLLVERAGVAAIAFHPRTADAHHEGHPDYALVRELRQRVGVPVIVSGGLSTAVRALRAYEESTADALMLARGAIGNPWIFGELTGARAAAPTAEEVIAELLWVVDRAEQHLGRRACHYLRKLYPPYLERLGVGRRRAAALQRLDGLERVRAEIARLGESGFVAA